MTEKWKEELAYSTYINQKYVFPIIREWLQNKIESVEDKRTDHKIIKLLDSFAGIDAIEVDPNKGIRGIALRCQWVSNKRFDSFTVRHTRANGFATEFGKRLFQMISEQGWIYPALTVQSYFQKNGRERTEELLSVGMTMTRSIYEVIHSQDFQLFTSQDGNKYAAVGWDQMVRLGYHVNIHRS